MGVGCRVGVADDAGEGVAVNWNGRVQVGTGVRAGVPPGAASPAASAIPDLSAREAEADEQAARPKASRPRRRTRRKRGIAAGAREVEMRDGEQGNYTQQSKPAGPRWDLDSAGAPVDKIIIH